MNRDPPDFTPFPSPTLSDLVVFDALWSRAFAGLKQHSAQVTPPLIDQLTHEIDEVCAQEVGPFLLYAAQLVERAASTDRKSTRLNSSHANISYAVFCLKKKT